MIRLLQLLFISSFLVSGCALVRYQHPTESTAPTLTFINKSAAKVAVFGYAEAAECKNPINISEQSSSYIDLNTGKSEKIRIRSNEAFSFLISMRAFPKECFLVGTLTPKPSNDYMASIFYDGKMCYVSVNRLQNGIEISDTAFTPRTHKMPLSGGFSACADKLPPHGT